MDYENPFLVHVFIKMTYSWCVYFKEPAYNKILSQAPLSSGKISSCAKPPSAFVKVYTLWVLFTLCFSCSPTSTS
jgi:hypothetical protein